MNSKNAESLQKIAFFEGLSASELDTVACVMIERFYPKGTVLFLEGDKGEALFLILQGRIKISKASVDGRQQILQILKDGDIFAEVILFDQGPYPATAEAVEDSTCWLLRSADMVKLLQNQPMLAVTLLRIMSRRLRQAQLLIRDLALHDAYGRMAGLLLQFSQREGKKTRDGVLLDLELTRQELANMIGTTRETVTRILSRFQKDGILTLDKQRIIIRDEEKLCDWT